MAIVQISKIQVRRGLEHDLSPGTLDSGELGWSVDTRKLYIGNGTAQEGGTEPGHKTEILTEFSIVNFTTGFASNVTNLESNVSTLQTEVTLLQSGVTTSNSAVLSTSTNNPVEIFSTNSAVVSYTLNQSTNQRAGTIKADRVLGTNIISFDEDYTQTGTTDANLWITANSTACTFWANVTAPGTLLYRITTL